MTTRGVQYYLTAGSARTPFTAGLPHFVAVRGRGMMIGVELDAKGLGAVYMDKLRARGLIALASGTYGEGISITPALTLSEADWQASLRILQATLAELA